MESAPFPAAAFRPQYIYGPKANKFTYLDYYFDRISSSSPLPVPGSGSQLVSLTDARDVASMLAKSVRCKGKFEVYNCGGPVYKVRRCCVRVFPVFSSCLSSVRA